MTRHGRNNTASACYTYHERQRDAKTGGYGTQKARLGKDSVKDFDACCLTLQPCRNPVITPDGYIFDKEAILEYIIQKKNDANRKLKEYEKNKKREEKELAELAAAEERSKAERFVQLEKNILNKNGSTSSSDVGREITATISNMVSGKAKQLPSFWIPSETPNAGANKPTGSLTKPDTNVYCPMSGKPLKHKDLYEVMFTPIDRTATGTTSNNADRYMCPVTHDVLGNSVPCAFLKTSGSVVTMECVEKIIRKDMMDPTNGKKLKETDIIPVQRGGTGYASTNQVLAAVKKPVMQA